MTKTIEDLEPGDKAAISYAYGGDSRYAPVMVTRVTKTLIITSRDLGDRVVEGRWRRRDGWAQGASTYDTTRLVILTPQVEQDMLRQRRVRTILAWCDESHIKKWTDDEVKEVWDVVRKVHKAVKTREAVDEDR